MLKKTFRILSFSVLIFTSTLAISQAQIPGQVPPGQNPNTTPTNNNVVQNNSANLGAGPYVVGSQVMVRWKNRWWPAQVLQVGPKRWFIHYDGYSNAWDEWVGPSRIRPR